MSTTEPTSSNSHKLTERLTPISNLGDGATAKLPAMDEDAATAPTEALPDFEAPTEAELKLNEKLPTVKQEPDGAPMSRHIAAEFADENAREHRNNMISIALVLLAPAFLFGTLWWPFGVAPARSFGEKNPTLATVVGLLLALVIIVVGLIVHFLPRERHDLLTDVEEGELVPSEESIAHAEDLKENAKKQILMTRAAGAIAACAALICVIFALTSLGRAATVFGFLALASIAVSVSFAFFYVPFTTRRTVRQLGA